MRIVIDDKDLQPIETIPTHPTRFRAYGDSVSRQSYGRAVNGG